MQSYFTRYTFVKIWYLSAIEIIDTQVARRGRQYHRNPPPYKNRPTKKNRIYKIKNHPTTAAQPNPTQHQHQHHQHHPSYKNNRPTKKSLRKLVMSNRIKNNESKIK